MSTAHVESDRVIESAARWLPLAAAPTFATMALLTVVVDDPLAVGHGAAAHGGRAVGDMPLMYLLMAVFHSTPWLKQIDWWRRRRGPGGESEL